MELQPEPEPELEPEPEPEQQPEPDNAAQVEPHQVAVLEQESEPELEPIDNKKKKKKKKAGKKKPSKKGSANQRRASQASLDVGYVARAPKTPVQRRPPPPDAAPRSTGRGLGVDYMAVLSQTGPAAKHRQSATTSPARDERQPPAARRHVDAIERLQPARNRSQPRGVDQIVEEVKQRVAEREHSLFAQNTVGHSAGTPNLGSSRPMKATTKPKRGFRAGGGSTTSSIEEEERRVAARVAARHAPQYARPPPVSRQRAGQRTSAASAAAAADLCTKHIPVSLSCHLSLYLNNSFDRRTGLKENSIRSTWQFPSPPAVATAKAAEFVVPPRSPPQMKAKQQSKAPDSGAVKKKKKRPGSGSHDDQRLGSEEQQIGHVNWSSTLRNDVWGDEMTRYIGINPKHTNGEDWRSPRLQTGNPKVHPPDSLVLGASGSTQTTQTQTNTGADASTSNADASAR